MMFLHQILDLLICIGSRLSTPLIGRNTAAFTRGAKKVVIDIDKNELTKGTINIDLAIQCDARVFLQELLKKKSQTHCNRKTGITIHEHS